MKQQTSSKTPPQQAPALQVKVRTGLVAGASLDSCLQNLEYWQKEYYNKCGY